MINWYFAAEGAQPLPFRSGIHSLNWLPAEERTPTAIGEIPGAPRPWRNGSMAHRPPGTHWHGQEAWFRTGSPAIDPIPRTPTGLPVACLGPPVPTFCCGEKHVQRMLFGHVTNKQGLYTVVPDLVPLMSTEPPGEWRYDAEGMDLVHTPDVGTGKTPWALRFGCFSGASPPESGFRCIVNQERLDGTPFPHQAPASPAEFSCHPFRHVFDLVVERNPGEVVGSMRVRVTRWKDPAIDP